MTLNKKFWYIYFLFVLFPNILILFAPSLQDHLNFENDVYANFSLFLLLLSIIACLYLLYKNYTSRNNNKFWYIFAALSGAVLAMYFYTAYSIMNINFF